MSEERVCKNCSQFEVRKLVTKSEKGEIMESYDEEIYHKGFVVLSNKNIFHGIKSKSICFQFEGKGENK